MAVPLLGMYQARADGWEADDVMATIARTWRGPTIIYTIDHDLIQLVSEGVDVYRPKHGILNVNNVSQSEADGIRDRMALAGDPGDGVAGVAGVGEKKANLLLDECPMAVRLLLEGRDDEVRECIKSKHAAKVLEAVIDRRQELEIAYRLVTLYTVEFEIAAPSSDPARLSKWLSGHGLDYLASKLAA
jgi:5'-3' exonuclease